MEDQHLASGLNFTANGKKVSASVFGIFDGHGGDGASYFTSRHMNSYLSNNLSKFCKNGIDATGISQALRQTFLEIDAAYGGEAGTTATVALMIDGDLWIANAGDSRAVLKNGDGNTPFFGYKAQQLTKDMKPSDNDCQKSIEKRGGLVAKVRGVSRVNSILAVGRAIGDWGIQGSGNKKCISPLPKITHVPKNKIAQGSELILACDGLWDVASSKQAAYGVNWLKSQGHDNGRIASHLGSTAYKAGSQDNISVMVVSL